LGTQSEDTLDCGTGMRLTVFTRRSGGTSWL